MNGVEKMENIIIYHANENNLKNIDVEIPLTAFSCITGPSGCGKSSLIYDTIYAESQRNFLESMSGNMYGQKLMDKPKVGEIKNLRPALNVSQYYYNVNPRSTIGTITDISYYLRTLYALIDRETNNVNVDANYFSFNNPSSCCERCKGLGEEYVISEKMLIPDQDKTLENGGILYYKGPKTSEHYKYLEAICEHYGIDMSKKMSELLPKEKEVLLYRKEPVEFNIKFRTPKGRTKQKIVSQKGALAELENLLKDIDTPSTFANISKYLTKVKCTGCGGNRLKKEVLSVQIAGKNIAEVENMTFDNLIIWINEVERNIYKSHSREQMEQLIFDIKRRVQNLIILKLEYLTLARSIPNLSGGEIQRVRLANQLACSLSGIVYILDEPCKGLHYRDINSVIKVTKSLIEKDNTVIAIEHNKQYISEADKIIELGPVGGPKGGYLMENHQTKNDYTYHVAFKESTNTEKFIRAYGIEYHNLKNVDVKIPYEKITCVSGVSGSGKSTLVKVIGDSCEKQRPVNCKEISNIAGIKKVLYVNQQPIGKTPRSTVVSYLGIYDTIRQLFAYTEKAKKNGLSSSDFSMNIPGGRCEICQGTGKKKIELTYLPDSYIKCPECQGKRFHNDVLEVKYKGYNINDILDKPIGEIKELFNDIESIQSILQCMIDIGLDYISLGQMSMNLSGGEAQRIKLAKCLGANSKGRSLYILDEPTAGLNDKDIALLEKILLRLNQEKETVLIIEHNIEFISHVADYLVDLGKNAGNRGGKTVIQGNPIEVVKNVLSSWDMVNFHDN